MTAIVIKPRNKKEETFLKELLRKMKVETHIVEEFVPNYETIKAMQDAENKKGVHVKIPKNYSPGSEFNKT